MRIKNIRYPSPLSEVKDIENDNIDVFVETDDGMTYTFVITTPNNYYWYMDKQVWIIFRHHRRISLLGT